MLTSTHAVSPEFTAAAGLNDKQVDALEGADIRTLGELQDAMTRDGLFWAKNRKINAKLAEGVNGVFNDYIIKVAQAK